MESYLKIKESIVAIAARNSKKPGFPHIIGTGFFIREDGIVLTNQHVVEAIRKLPAIEGKTNIGDLAIVLKFIESEKGVGILPLIIDGAIRIEDTQPFDSHYGPKTPDVSALVLKDVCDCPCPNLFDGKLKEGQSVGIAGFPMGTDTLKAPGWIHQIGSTLQKGVTSAILPFPCENPHAILLDIMVQGGSSGSPVFCVDTGDVVGIVYAGLQDFYSGIDSGNRIVSFYQVPTSLTLAVPSCFLKKVMGVLDNCEEVKELKQKKVPLEDWIEKLKVNIGKPKDLNIMEPVNSRKFKLSKQN